jgi:acyl-CoA reductase-like NAD-dependent aldehyde dehydrogenase
MPIVFDQVTAQVEPEARNAPPAQAAQPAGAQDSPDERADALRQALALMAERALRLKAD